MPIQLVLTTSVTRALEFYTCLFIFVVRVYVSHILVYQIRTPHVINYVNWGNYLKERMPKYMFWSVGQQSSSSRIYRKALSSLKVGR